jgi:hypothetical protein
MFKDIPAFHRMKHPNSIVIKDIIKDFNRIGIPVKTDNQPFVFSIFIVFNLAIVFGGIMLSGLPDSRPPNVSLGNTVLKRRLAKSDVNVHVLVYNAGHVYARFYRSAGVPGTCAPIFDFLCALRALCGYLFFRVSDFAGGLS